MSRNLTYGMSPNPTP